MGNIISKIGNLPTQTKQVLHILLFFIDLMDDYNQSEYYSLNNQNEASCVPDDKISEIPISVLEDIILSSSSFSVVEQKLRDYVSSHEDEKKGITIENLQILLNCYNNE